MIEINFVFILSLSNNFFDTRVSSQIKSEFFNNSMALKVISHLPIGVGIKYNPFLTYYCVI